jgi:hypothetical protein
MRSLKYLACLALLGTLPSCQVGTSISPQPTPSISNLTPQPSSKPTLTPGPLPEESPSPAPTPLPTAIPGPPGLQQHSYNLYCANETQAPAAPKIEEMADFSVTPDGQHVYLLYQRQGVISQDCKANACVPQVIPRQWIYSITAQSTRPQPLTITNPDLFTCGLGEQLEQDGTGGLILHSPILTKLTHQSIGPLGHRLLRWHPEKHTLTEVWSTQFRADAPLNTANDLGLLSSLHLSANQMVRLHNPMQPQQAQTLYFGLQSSDTAEGDMSSLQRIKWEDNRQTQAMERVLSLGRIILPYLINTPHAVLFGFWRLQPPFQFSSDLQELSFFFNAQQPRPRGVTDMRFSPDQKYVYMSDIDHPQIWKVDISTGNIIPWVGSQSSGFVDNTGSKAQFSSVRALDVDAAGNVYVFDKGNLAIRKITPSGQVTTFYKEEPHAP